MQNAVLISGAVLGGLAVILGAFGAYAFKKILSEEKSNSFETGVRYQMYGALALLIIGFSLDFESNLTRWAYYGIFYGTVLFSGSIYLLSFKEYWKADAFRFLGPVTPVGGLLMVIGWACLFLSFVGL